MSAVVATSADLTTFTITANGQALPTTFRLEYMDIRRMTNRISNAELAFLDGSAADQEFALSAASELRPGSDIEISLGYSNAEQPVFKGKVVKQQIKITRTGGSRLIVSCRDASYAMALNSQSAHFSDLTDSDLISLLANNHQISANVESTSVTYTDIVQLRQSDWDFIIQRAERSGLFVSTVDGKLNVASVQTDAAKMDLAFGRDILDADLQIDAQQQFASTTALSWSSSEQDNSEQSGSASLSEPGDTTAAALATAAGGGDLQLRADGNLNPNALQNWANAAVERQQLAKVQGTVTIQGSASLNVGDWVELKGMGATFNGLAFVGGLMHSVSRGNWLTTIQIGMAAQWHMEQFSSAVSSSTPSQGLHIAKVVAISADPHGEERIQVKIMTLGSDHEGVWARMVTLDAGNDRGWVTRPEVDDEVIIGFIDNDATQPIIIGSLFSSANPAPLPADDDDNHQKGWVTRSGMRMVFDDDVVALTIETPAGNLLKVSEESEGLVLQDQNDNSITLDGSGITLNSASDLKLDATGDVTINGTNITLESISELNLKASSNATLEAGAMTTITGSLVKVN